MRRAPENALKEPKYTFRSSRLFLTGHRDDKGNCIATLALQQPLGWGLVGREQKLSFYYGSTLFPAQLLLAPLLLELEAHNWTESCS